MLGDSALDEVGTWAEIVKGQLGSQPSSVITTIRTHRLSSY